MKTFLRTISGFQRFGSRRVELLRAPLIALLLMAACTTITFTSCTKRTEEASFNLVDYQSIGHYYRVNTIDFADNLNGLMVIDNHELWKTTDGGHNWAMVYDTTTGYFMDVVYTHRDTAYMSWVYGSYDDYELRRSYDGGLTWSKIDDFGEQFTMGFYNGKTGYINAAIPANSTPKIYRTINCGNTWTAVGTFTGATGHLLFFNYTRGVRTDLGNNLLYTTDAGVTWNNSISGEFYQFSKPTSDGILFCTDDQNGIFKTTDFGVTWSQCLAPLEGRICYTDVSRCGNAVVACNFQEVTYSDDLGVTWKNYLLRGVDDLHDYSFHHIYMIDEHHALAVADVAQYSDDNLLLLTFP